MSETEGSPPDTRNLNFFAINVGLGPPLGMLGVLGLAAVSQIVLAMISPPVAAAPGHFELLPFLTGLISLCAFSYIFGIVPAVLHALTMIVLARFLPNRLIWSLLMPISGFAATALVQAAISFNRDNPSSWAIIDPSFFCVGAGSAIVCAGLARLWHNLPPMGPAKASRISR